jgi:hypothetical protein
VAIGLAAAGQPASAMRTGSLSLADYLKSAVSTDVGTNGELLLARVSQPDTGDAATVVTQLKLAKSNGEYGADLYSDALAILGLSAAGQSVGDDAVKFLKDHQAANGAWSFDGSDQFTDSNTTAIVILALLNAGVLPGDSILVKAFDYLATTFNQGGFAYAPGATPDGNSDEIAIQAILRAKLEGSTGWKEKLIQALGHLAGQQVAAGADAGAIAGISKLFATTLAPSVFLLRPLTATGPVDEKVTLLSCPASSSPTPGPSASPVPAPTSRAAGRLAQTGLSLRVERLGVGCGILLLGALVFRRRPPRARNR